MKRPKAGLRPARMRVTGFHFRCTRPKCFGDLADTKGRVSFTSCEYPNEGDLSGVLRCEYCGEMYRIADTDRKTIEK